MGTTKDRIFSDATNEMATMLRALGHPARFEIINLLKSEKTCCG
ncbi:MAG: transcriptional regulator, partial [Flavobacterium sp.]|nr:transcriptional regulator [Flavobacterium sp.]